MSPKPKVSPVVAKQEKSSANVQPPKPSANDQPPKPSADVQPPKLPAAKSEIRPSSFKPLKLPAASKPAPTIKKTAEASSKTASASVGKPKPPGPVKTSLEPVKTSVTPHVTRPVRTLMPKWTPPAMKSTSTLTSPSSGSQTPSPMIGFRVGLSRNFKPAKPLHTSFKSPG